MTDQHHAQHAAASGLEDAFDPRAFLGRVGAGKTIERYAKNQKIFSQGDVADAVFFIQKGKVKITVLSEHGKEAVVGIFAEGQFFGEACLDGAELTHRNQPGHGRVPDHLDDKTGDAGGPRMRSRGFPHFSSAICCPATAGSKTT